MTASIYLETGGRLKLAKGFPRGQDLGEIEFYVHSVHGEHKQVFLIMRDEQGLLEIIELNFDRVDKGYPYKIYKVSLRQSVRLSEGMVHIKLMTLDLDTAQYTVSNDIPVYLTT